MVSSSVYYHWMIGSVIVVVLSSYTRLTVAFRSPNRNIVPAHTSTLTESSQFEQRQKYGYCNTYDSLRRLSETSTVDDNTSTQQQPETLDGRKINGPILPLNNFVLVRVAKAVEETTGGILLTGKAKQVKTEGTVIAVGPGKTHPDSGITIPIPVQPGMNVVYGKYDGTEIDYNNQKHTLIRDDDILITFTSPTLSSLDTVEVVRDNILVYVEQKEVATEGGILIAKTSKSESKPSIGLVVKIGPGKMTATGETIPISKSSSDDKDDDDTLLQIGDYIKFRDYAGNEVDIDGKEYTVVKMADVLAKF
jgi:chaperonin GroES